MEFVVNVDSVDEREAWHAAVADSPIADFLVFSPDLHEVSPGPHCSTQPERRCRLETGGVLLA
jgi:hypothetical protein